MRNSMKQLLRTPGKAILFFLLIAVCSFFLTISSALTWSSNQRIEAAERQFTTIATVEQKPDATFTESGVNSCMGAYANTYSVFDELLSVDVLDFEGANYTTNPEERAYYLTQCH